MVCSKQDIKSKAQGDPLSSGLREGITSTRFIRVFLPDARVQERLIPKWPSNAS